MALKQYVCNFFKELQIGSNTRGIKFRDGFYETDDPENQALIESSQGFNVHIHFKDSLAEMERIGKERQEKESGEKARKRKEFLAEMDTEDKAKDRRAANGEQSKAKAAEKDKGKKKLAAADKVL